MSMEVNIVISSLLLTTLLVSLSHVSADGSERKAYIVYMGEALQSHTLAMENHHSLLYDVIQDEEVARQSLIYSYGKSFDGFAAYVTPDEAARLEENENVVSVFPNTMLALHTSRSWDFIGMPISVKRKPQIETDIIVGMLDSGIYIDSPSFDDKGLGPPPSKWKGVCQTGANFTGCNNKVIGARTYDKISPADHAGHGTHTASTVAGVPVEDASLFGLGKGTARGGVPLARIAVYKVCGEGCSAASVLAGFDDAINDGVDIISLSLGGSTFNLYTNPIAIGTFHAMRKGILTSASAGNNGPMVASLFNGVPWILTVGASTTDRTYSTPIQIGNDIKTSGVSLNTVNLEKKMYPLTSGVLAAKKGAKLDEDNTCEAEQLDANKVKGKIVHCHGRGLVIQIKSFSGVGVIITKEERSLDTAQNYVLPAACVKEDIGKQIDKYLNSTKEPQGVILKTVTVNRTAAPVVASFSSIGPDIFAPSFLKPDLVAPGVSILAAFTKHNSVSRDPSDDRFSLYNIFSGTSMSCPHATAAAAYVKSFHPDWHTSAIKSALMTTATEMKIKDKYAELAYGAGQIDPQRAVDPGLLYEVDHNDYIRFLCNKGYNGTKLEKIIGEPVDCSSIPKFGGQDDLNYPSMVLKQKDLKASISAVFNRTVRNVGDASSTYKANVKAPDGLKITVTPEKLVFKEVNETKSFTVELKGPPLKDNSTLLSASLEWSDSVHRVRSPILVYPHALSIPQPVPPPSLNSFSHFGD